MAKLNFGEVHGLANSSLYVAATTLGKQLLLSGWMPVEPVEVSGWPTTRVQLVDIRNNVLMSVCVCVCGWFF